ncbi:Hypothetical predicted protein [Pelobates cultripes]|nr:Hypothetical predicted protein [Pelobates cultripes]
MAGDEKTKIVRERLFLYGPNPSPELVQQLMAEADADIQAARAHKLSLITAQRATGPTTTITPSEITGKRKIAFAAFKSFLESEVGINEFLDNFERQCALHQIHIEEWPTIMSGKLSG